MTTIEIDRMDYGPGRSAPHALEAEEAVLGCILINPEAYHEVAWFLRPEDFYLHKHRWIHDAFGALTEQQRPIDIITVADALEKKGQLGEIGGSAYLTRLIGAVPTSLHAEAYGRLVEREAIRRKLLEAASTVAKLAYAEARDITEVVNEANAAVLAVYRDRHNQAQTLADASGHLFARIKHMLAHPEDYLGVPTGLIDVDHLLGGMMPSDLVIVAGRPGTGKTAYMVQVGKFAAAPYDTHGRAKSPKRVAIYSLEMGNDQLAMRALAGDCAIDVRALRLAKVDEADWPRLVQVANQYGGYALYLDDSPALTPNQLRAKTARLEAEIGPVDLIIVDYLQLMQSDGKRENRTQEIGQISRGLKQLARERRAVVLAGAQLSRGVEHRADKKPVLADLREGGSQEQDADVVKLLSRAEQPNLVNLDIAKFRNGQTGTVQLYFNAKYARFENAAVGTVDLAAA